MDDPRLAELDTEIRTALRLRIPEFRSALLHPVRNCLDLDLLWAEFLATGNTDAVDRILEVLEWKDLLRLRIEEWLNVNPGRRVRKKAFSTLEQAYGLHVDVDSGKIRTAEDLDIWLVLDGAHRDLERPQRIRERLPFALTEDEVVHLGIKSAAKWSLASNAAKHPRVLEAVVEATRDSGEQARLSLLEIQADAHRLNWNPDQVEAAASEYLRLNPDNDRVRRLRDEAAEGSISFPIEPAKIPPWYRVVIDGAALIAVVWLSLSVELESAFQEVTHVSIAGAIVSGCLALTVAVLGGSFRLFCNGLLERAAVIETDSGPVYLGTVPGPFWFSPQVRFAWWFGVAVASIWAAGVFAAAFSEEASLWGTRTFAFLFVTGVVFRWAASKTLFWAVERSRSGRQRLGES